MGLLQIVRRGLVVFGALYASAVLFLAIPSFQTHVLYLHAVRLPWSAKFSHPEKYGLAPGKTVNFNIETPDGVSIGSWFIYADKFYQQHDEPSNLSVEAALKTHPTILFLHGNAATRALDLRVAHYTAFSSRLGANVLAIDYRGFGDSTGSPSEAGLAIDSRAAFDWLCANGAKEQDILIVGHSLGTGVTSLLASDLSASNIVPRGIVLLSPFSSIRTLLDTYRIVGFLPLMRPISFIPRGGQFVTWALTHKFDTLSRLHNITAPLMIAHAMDDWDIPHTHSDTLFDALLEPRLPPIPVFTSPYDNVTERLPLQWSEQEWDQYNRVLEQREILRTELVTKASIPGFGDIAEFDIKDIGKENEHLDEGEDTLRARKVVLLKLLFGGHDRIGNQEGLHDVMRRVFGFQAI